MTVGLQAFDFARLLLGHDFGQHCVDANPARYGLRRTCVVARYHRNLQAEIVQRVDRGAAAFLEGVGNGEHRHGAPFDGGVQRCLALVGELLCSLRPCIYQRWR